MNIVWTRRISQMFFLVLFLWLCAALVLNNRVADLREQSTHFFLYADPLIALSVALASGVITTAFVWALGTLALTLVVGRFFCGWVCPLGTLQQAVGWAAHLKQSTAARVRSNTYHRAQGIKYALLLVILVSAGTAGLSRWLGRSVSVESLTGSLLTGFLDPITLMQRAINLALIPLVQRLGFHITTTPHFYAQAGWTGGVVLALLACCMWRPRFYCRYVCPLGALLGLVARWSFWRVGRTSVCCTQCLNCERDCEGACSPSDVMRPAECVLCFNCLHVCPDQVMHYQLWFPEGTYTGRLDVGRRGFLVSVAAGIVTIPLIRLSRVLSANFNPRLIRPPGSLPEHDFLARCIKCGQCMAVCPTNIIQPAALEAGAEGVWTPVLNYRIGTSGCLPTCLACGKACPTGALRELTLDERLGQGVFEGRGPVRMGLAFIDRGRCLPWAMSRPCIVCQEVCPISPKAIYLAEQFAPLRQQTFKVLKSDELTLFVGNARFRPGSLAIGDLYVRTNSDEPPRRIVANTDSEITIESSRPFSPPPHAGSQAVILVRLQLPIVDPRYCIGCGICEHNCPIAGQKAIRVSAENESRHPDRRVLLSEPGGT